MLTIGRLAAYAGVSVATVRHYHDIGLLPEPERDASGYRSYDAAAVVRLIRIHVLAAAGVPLARVEQLLDADDDGFAGGVAEVDARLRAQIRQLQRTRRRLATLASGERLALPDSVVGYLDRLRQLGVSERYIAMERDAWIMVAAQIPDRVDEQIADKHRFLDDPDLQRFYLLVSDALGWQPDDPRVVELADLLARVLDRHRDTVGRGHGFDSSFPQLLESTTVAAGPVAQRLIDLLADRGWSWLAIQSGAAGG